MSHDPNPPLPDDFDPDTPRPFVLPPPGPVVHWDFSPADLLDWRDADTELTVHPKRGLGDLQTHASLLAGLLCCGIRSSQRLLREVPDALAAVRAGRMESWIRELIEYNSIGIRPDAVWVHYGHAYPGQDLRAFPLDGMEAVLDRWAEVVQRYNE